MKKQWDRHGRHRDIPEGLAVKRQEHSERGKKASVEADRLTSGSIRKVLFGEER